MENELNRIKKLGVVQEQMEEKKAREEESELIYNDSNSKTAVAPYRIMPNTKNVSEDFTITCAYGWVSMRLSANVTIDAQGAHIMYLNSYSIYPNGAFVNFTSYELQNVSYAFDKPSGAWIAFYIKGRTRFEYTDPVAQITTGYYLNSTETVKVDCN